MRNKYLKNWIYSHARQGGRAAREGFLIQQRWGRKEALFVNRPRSQCLLWCRIFHSTLNPSGLQVYRDCRDPARAKGCGSSLPLARMFVFRSLTPFVPFPSRPPCRVLVPVFFALPFSPVRFQLSVGDSVVPVRHTAIMRRERRQGVRHVAGGEIHPGAVVRTRSEPVTFMGAIPVPMIEKNAHINIGDQINICSGYHDHRRWGLEFEGGRKADTDVDLHSCTASVSIFIIHCEKQSHSNRQYQRSPK